MTTDDLRTRARAAAEEAWWREMEAGDVARDRGGYTHQGFIDGYLAHAAQQPTRDDLIGWDDRKELADVFQDAGARFPVEGLSDDLYSALLAVAQWGAERASELNGAGS